MGKRVLPAEFTTKFVMLMLKFCVASTPMPFVAVTVPVNRPPMFGVPVIAPAALSNSGGGSAPAVTENVGAG